MSKSSEANKRYYEANKERIRAVSRAYYEANKEKCKAQTAKWRAEHPERIKELSKRHNAKDTAERQAKRQAEQERLADLEAFWNLHHTKGKLMTKIKTDSENETDSFHLPNGILITIPHWIKTIGFGGLEQEISERCFALLNELQRNDQYVTDPENNLNKGKDNVN